MTHTPLHSKHINVLLFLQLLFYNLFIEFKSYNSILTKLCKTEYRIDIFFVSFPIENVFLCTYSVFLLHF